MHAHAARRLAPASGVSTRRLLRRRCLNMTSGLLLPRIHVRKLCARARARARWGMGGAGVLGSRDAAPSLRRRNTALPFPCLGSRSRRSETSV